MSSLEVITLGGGCFWCVEACYRLLKGVKRAVSGYEAGHVVNPTYEQVCGKGTGHAEVVQVAFDPAVISLTDILKVFFTIHDPTTPNRQGNDVGPQYRSIILYRDEQQKEVAQKVMAWVAEQGWYTDKLVTELVPSQVFYPAEDYHQEYFNKNPGQGYCRAVVAPKVAKFRAKFVASLQ